MKLQIINNKILIYLILIIGLVIRIINPTFGSPVLYVVPDEVPNYLAGFEMIAKRTLITSSQYPPLGSYILLPFYISAYLIMRLSSQVMSLSQFELYLLTHEGFLLFIPRLISAVFGTVSLVVVCKLAHLIFPGKRMLAIWATLITAFSVTHVQLSHLGKPWMGSQFFYLLGIYYFSKGTLNNDQSTKLNLISASCFVFALGFHFSAIYGFILIFIIPFFYKRKIITFNNVLLFAIPFLSLLFYKSLMSYTYQISEFQNILGFNLNQGLLKGTGFYIKEFILTEPVLVVLLIISLVFIRLWPKIFYPLHLYSFIYFLIMSLTFYQSLRFLLPIIPLLSLPAVFAFTQILKYFKSKPIRILIICIFFILLVFPPLLWLTRFTKTPTFILSQRWINRNIPVTTPIAISAVRFSPFVPNLEGMKIMQMNHPAVWGRLAQKLAPGSYPETVRNVVYLEKVIDINDPVSIKEFMLKQKMGYLVQVYWDPQFRLITKSPANWQLTARFTPKTNSIAYPLVNLIHGSANIYDLLQVERFGPYIDILEFKAG